MGRESHHKEIRNSAPNTGNGSANPLTSWTFEPAYASDPLLQEAMTDLNGKASILELFVSYMDEIRANPDNNPLQSGKMAALFKAGITPSRIEGHHYGVPLNFRTGDLKEPLSSIGNVVEVLWGFTLHGQSPWVGKSFSLAGPGVVSALTLGKEYDEQDASLGINHFNRLVLKTPNTVSFFALNMVMRLKDPPADEQQKFGHDRNGCAFLSHVNDSVYGESPRKVYQLNYRWKNLNNVPPLCWLIDELVEVSRGLYLGQLLFATDRLLGPYDPEAPVTDHHYQHFGYFLLFDDTWNKEARRLLPFLEIPENAPGMTAPSAGELAGLSKFSTFTFTEGDGAVRDETLYRTILGELKEKSTIMHLLKDYSLQLQGSWDNKSPIFLRLREIFNRGQGIEDMEGYYHGALVSWHSEGIFKLFDVNTLNLVWTGLAAKFSTWTGKFFEAISAEKLAQFTDGRGTGIIPTRWGSNTQSLRTFKERFVGNLTDIAQVWNEPVPQEEAVRNGYDVKNFFFIARKAQSISEESKGKPIYQLNYRWPKLRTIVPDRLCIDELVKIAEGLYLGQLMYATNVLLPYDPDEDPSAYQYGCFGFFLLMDEEWQQIRLRIGYDLTNT